MSEHLHRAPAKCPVCAHELSTSRLSCAGCGTELVGQFERCRFCTLPPQQLELLTVFLASRGNLREVARHQGVSYPTARARLAGLLAALGLDEIGQEEPEPDGAVVEPEPPGEAIEAPSTRQSVLTAVADGRITPQQAAELIRRL